MRSLIALAYATATAPALAQPPAAVTGSALYTEHCAACHGAQLEGAPDWQRRGPDGLFPAPPHDETGHTWHHGDGFLFAYIKYGGQTVLDELGVAFTSGMPGFDGILTDTEIEAILAYISSTWPPAARAFQQTQTAQEREEGRFQRP